MAEFDQINQLLANLRTLQKELEATPESAQRFSQALAVIKKAYSDLFLGIRTGGDADAIRESFALVAQAASAYGQAGSEAGRKVAVGMRETLARMRELASVYDLVARQQAINKQGAAADVPLSQILPPDMKKYDDAMLKMMESAMERAQAQRNRDIADTKLWEAEQIASAKKVADAQAAAAEKAKAAADKKRVAEEKVRQREKEAADFATEAQARTLSEIEGVLSRGGVSAQQFNAAIASTGKSLDELVESGSIRFVEDMNSGVAEFTIKMQTADGVTRQMRGSLDGLGNVQSVSIGRFRTLGDTILRNITEVAKWSLSVGVVYGTMNQLNQAVSTAIENQTKLAEIQTVLGDSSRSLNDVFDSALSIARSTGSSVQGVLDSYTEAIRVTANISDETARFASANKLLRDSLVLSKLGAFEQREAMDLLIATLNQLNIPLTEGSETLDKWVAVSRIAGVSLQDLATAYSITAGSAELAGIKVGGATDQLSGFIAALAEQFPYEGKELGNRFRALVAGFGDSTRQQALFDIGVSPLNAQGELRDWQDIMGELAELYRNQIISEKQLGAVAGNNARERNILIGAVQNYNRALQINAQAANSSGSAEQALGVQLKTVDTAIKNLQNAFTSFANTLGTDGGVLEAITQLVELTTGLVEALDSLVSVTGRAGPALAALFGGNMLLGRVFGMKGGPLGALAAGVTSRLAGSQTATQTALPGFGVDPLMASVPRQPGFGAKFAGSAAAGLVGVAINQALRDEVDWNAAAAGLVGTIAGSFAGPYGGLIGGQIAMGIVDAIQNEEEAVDSYGERVAQSFAEHVSSLRPEIDADTGPLEESIEQATTRALSAAIAESSTGFTRMLNSSVWGFYKIISDIPPFFGMDTPSASSRLAETYGFDPELAQILEDSGNFKALTDAIAALAGGASIESIEMHWRALLGMATAADAAALAQDNLNQKVDQMRPTNYDQIVQQARDDLAEDPSKYAEYLNIRSNLDSAILRSLTLIKKVGPELRAELGLATDQALQDFFVAWAIAAPPAVVQKVQAIAELDEDASRAEIQSAVDEIAFLMQNTLEQEDIRVPITIDTSGIEDADMLNEVFALAEQLAMNYAEGLAQGIAREKGIAIAEARLMAHEIVDAQREVVLLRAGEVYAPFEIAGRDYFNTAQQMLQQQRQSARGGGRTSVGFQEIDLPSAAWGEIQNRINYFATQLGRLGYQQNKTPQVIRFADNIIQVKDVDSQLLQLALNELIDINRDQLEGIYNLPSDASFYVPFTGYKLGFGEGGMTGGGPPPIVDIAGSDMIKSAGDSMLTAADIMNQAALLMSQSQQQGKPLPDWNPSGAQAPLTYNVQAIQSLANLPSAIQTGIGKAVAGVTSQINSGMDERRFREGQYGALYEAQRYDPSTQQLSAAVNILGNSVNALSFNLTDLFNTIKSLKDQVPPVDLRLQIQSNNMLNLDGRVIAASVSNHIAQSLVRFGGSQGGASVRFII